MKIFFRTIHLYLSLAAGLVILTACATGAILVFEKDIQQSLNKDRYFVKPGQTRIALAELSQTVYDSFPKAKINGVKIYKDPSRSIEFSISLPEKKEGPGLKAVKTENSKAAQRQPGYTIFIDPYSGKVLEKYSYRETFFYTVFALHRWLLGGEGSIGKYIVGISTFIFLFILMTGIILWWPKTRNMLQQRLKIKWNAGWKRLNHDLHIVFGFYSALFLFIFAFTGLAWSFEWFNNGIYKVTNSPLKSAPPPKSVYVAGAPRISFDEALAIAGNVHTDALFYHLASPKDPSDALTVTILNKGAVHEGATDALYIDQYSGKVLGKLAFGERSLGARVRSTFKPIHTGSIWGTPSKILACIVCLFGVSFPITGTFMWMNRTRKRTREQGTRNN